MEEIIWKDRPHHLGMPLSLTRYSLSESRLFIQSGLLTTVNEEIQLFRIRDMRITRTLWEKIFRCGSITLFSSDRSTPKLVLRHIKKPLELKERLVKLVADEREKHHIYSDDMVSNMVSAMRETQQDG